MTVMECGEQRYCLEERITVVSISLPRISRDSFYYPTGFLLAMEKGDIALSDYVLLTEKELTIKKELEYPHRYFGYRSQSKDNTYFTNQFPKYKHSQFLLAGLAMINEYDYLWFLEKDCQKQFDEVYIDQRYFHYEQPFTSPHTQQLINKLFPCN